MLAKMILPFLGGTPGVWNTCMVFFQAALLAGYGYAHFVRTHLTIRRQVIVHCILLLLPLLVLPIHVEGWSPPAGAYPEFWLLKMLALCAGLPFFAVATSAPLLQDWFSRVRHRTSEDPYYLYAASNAGSLTALLVYPFVLEPSLKLAQQTWVWMAGYGFLVLLVFGCAALVWKLGNNEHPEQVSMREKASSAAGSSHLKVRDAVTLWTRLRWITLAFVPSSLLLGVTTFITTDIASIPLLWNIPLALYLLSFILVFSRLGPLLHLVMVPLLPISIVVVLVLSAADVHLEMIEAVALHLATFFVATMVCHGELARTRPAPSHLTEYYLLMALGGVLGGILNALVAPVVFDRVVEYPLIIAIACLLRPHLDLTPLYQLLRKWRPASAGKERPPKPGRHRSRSKTTSQRNAPSATPEPVAPAGSDVGLATAAWCAFGVAACFIFVFIAYGEGRGGVRLSDRNFFGVVQVREPSQSPFIEFYHGTTLHGLQSKDPSQRNVARSYFHRDGPIGQVMREFQDHRIKKEVGIIGLGVGSLAAYVNRGQGVTFYEIDPAVIGIARDTRYFTFLSDCEARGGRVKLVAGDGRLQLAQSNDRYDLLIADAFSSDSVPVHLVTRQAVQIYLDHLRDDGILAFNISAKYLRLESVLGDLAADAGLTALIQLDASASPEEIEALEQIRKTGRVDPRLAMKAMMAGQQREQDFRQAGRSPSKWVIMARDMSHFGKLANDPRWKPITRTPGGRVWSDDYSNLISVFVWSEQAEIQSQLNEVLKKPPTSPAKDTLR
jgi:hypothetical protein